MKEEEKIKLANLLVKEAIERTIRKIWELKIQVPLNEPDWHRICLESFEELNQDSFSNWEDLTYWYCKSIQQSN